MMISLPIVFVFAISYAILTWKWRLGALAVLIVLLPVYQFRFLIGGLPSTFLEVMIVLLVGITLFQERRAVLAEFREVRNSLSQQGIAWFKSPAGIAVIAILWLLIAAMIGLIVTPDLRAGLGIVKAYIVEPIVFVAVVPLIVQHARDRRILLGAFLLSAIGVALFAIFQFIFGWGIPAPWNEEEFRRAVSFFQYPNAVGLYLAPAASVMIGILVHGKTLFETEMHRLRWRIIILFGLIVSILGIVASRSDGALIAVTAACVVALFFTRLRWFVVALSLGGIGIGLLTESIRRVLLFQDVSGDVRLALWKGTWNLIQHRPFIGSGLGGFAEVYDQYRLPSHVELLEYSHNLFFDFWTQLGLLGVLWIITIVLTGVVVTIRGRKVTQGRSLIVLTVLVAFVVYGIVDVPYFKNDLAIISWCMFGSIWWICRAMKHGMNR